MKHSRGSIDPVYSHDRVTCSLLHLPIVKCPFLVCFRQGRCFFIKSCACDKVLGVKSQSRDSGAQVCIYTKKPEVCASQLWYEDENGLIRSKLNGYVLDSAGKFLFVYK